MSRRNRKKEDWGGEGEKRKDKSVEEGKIQFNERDSIRFDTTRGN